MRLVNTIREFLGFWGSYGGLGAGEMFGGWLTVYMARYPEVLEREVGVRGGLKGLEEAMVGGTLPRLEALIHDVFEAWMMALEAVRDVSERAPRVLGSDPDPTIVLYVGSGHAPLWETELVGRPALLLDLGCAAGLGWTTSERLKALVAHGYGFLYHAGLRGGLRRLEAELEDPFFKLYAVGLAQHYEHLILGAETWHPAVRDDWLGECRKAVSALAGEYLRKAEEGDVGSFYGGRPGERGIMHAGYFLGYELISWMRKFMGLNEIKTLSAEIVRELARIFLEELSPR